MPVEQAWHFRRSQACRRPLAGLQRRDHHSRVVVGRLFATPGDIKEAIKETDSYIRALALEVSATLITPWLDAREAGTLAPEDENVAHAYQPAFVEAFRAFFVEWDGFWQVHTLGTWAENFWGASWDRNLDYRKRAREFQKQFESLTGKDMAMPPLADPRGADPYGLPKIPWAPIIAVLVIVAIIMLAPPLIGAFAARRSSQVIS